MKLPRSAAQVKDSLQLMIPWTPTACHLCVLGFGALGGRMFADSNDKPLFRVTRFSCGDDDDAHDVSGMWQQIIWSFRTKTGSVYKLQLVATESLFSFTRSSLKTLLLAFEGEELGIWEFVGAGREKKWHCQGLGRGVLRFTEREPWRSGRIRSLRRSRIAPWPCGRVVWVWIAGFRTPLCIRKWGTGPAWYTFRCRSENEAGWEE